MNKTIERVIITGLLLLSAAFAANAQKAPRAQALKLSAEILSAHTPRQSDSTRALPGDTVRYHLLFTNVSAGAVHGIVLDNPIPAGLRYEVGSAKADRSDVAILYSIDGGKTFSPAPMIDAVVDGQHAQQPAPAEMYTHVRWTVRGDVPKGAQIRAEYDAQVPSVVVARSSTTK
ncbi:MAG TPA: hypothetical protein VGH98_06010 [Gemmatimonadaceae bacterium]|jgi:uncharacterized repeat protein (TIGR01451 family)